MSTSMSPSDPRFSAATLAAWVAFEQLPDMPSYGLPTRRRRAKRPPAKPTQSDIRRVVQGAKAVGLIPTGIKVNTRTGEIEIVTGKSEQPDCNPLDQWMAKHARKT
jgi:hypothetical protein